MLDDASSSAPQGGSQPQPANSNPQTPKVLPVLQSLIPALSITKKTAGTDAAPQSAAPQKPSEGRKPLFLSLSELEQQVTKKDEPAPVSEKENDQQDATEEKAKTTKVKPVRKRTRYKIVKKYVWRRKKKGTKWVKVKRLQKVRVKVKPRVQRKAVHQITVTKKTKEEPVSSSGAASATATLPQPPAGGAASTTATATPAAVDGLRWSVSPNIVPRPCTQKNRSISACFTSRSVRRPTRLLNCLPPCARRERNTSLLPDPAAAVDRRCITSSML